MDELNETQKNKKDKALFILGCVFLALAFAFTMVFAYYAIRNQTTPENQNLGNALGLVVILIYFGIPSLPLGILSVVFNVLSCVKARRHKALKLVFSVTSCALLALSIIMFLILAL